MGRVRCTPAHNPKSKEKPIECSLPRGLIGARGLHGSRIRGLCAVFLGYSSGARGTPYRRFRRRHRDGDQSG
ncbi:MAG: hypothetical protein EBZ45_02610, partial [Actinobacteria bacterium]|nr:hypothetical protein [Actinomycetota bacterium]